jgi:hypothetical protein
MYFNHGFSQGLLPRMYPVNTKLNIHAAEPTTVAAKNRRNFNAIIPATTGENVRMMGKKNPAINARRPRLL